jgi:hypothetical protein
MVRIDLWESRLAKLIDEARERPFVWGKNDCALFAADAVHELTGTDPAFLYRGRYDSEEEAGKILKKAGGLIGIMETLSESRGWKTVEPLYAQRGDVCLGDIDGRHTLGVCTGNGFAFTQQPVGLFEVTIYDHRVLMVWRIA